MGSETHAPQLAAFVLAGGKSSRMFADKARLRIGDRTLLEIAAAKAGAITSSVTVVASETKIEGFPHLSDIHPGQGPLGGIEAALLHTQSPWNLFLAVDAPMLPVKLLRGWTSDVLSRSSLASVLISGGVLQPLPILLHRDALPFVERAVRAGRLAVGEMLDLSQAEHFRNVEKIPADTYPVIAGVRREHWFLNINRPADLEFAESLDSMGELDI